MNVVFDTSFSKSLRKLKIKWLKKRIEQIILEAEQVDSIRDLSGVKKMEGFKNFYRIRVGEYRVGVELEDGSTVRFILVADRKDIYKKFP